MTRDRRSAARPPASFVWEALDSQAPDPRAGDDPTRDARREPGTHRASSGPGRALVAAAVLVPLAGGSYALIAHSTRHDDTTVVTAGVAQAPGLGAAASPGPGGGSTGVLGAVPGAGPSAASSRDAGTGSGVGASPQPSLPPSANKNSKTTADSPHAPSHPATTVGATPERTAAASAPPASGPTATQTATAKPTPSATKPGHPSCAAAWSSSTSYIPGQVVSYQGQNYTATYYSTDAAPNAAISWDVWTNDGACSS